MKTIPPDFESMPIESFSESICTPNVTDDWNYRGIKLNAPQKVIIRDYYVLPLCGSMQFSEKFLNNFDTHVMQNLIIVVTDLGSHVPYSGTLSNRIGTAPKITKNEGTDEELEANTSASFFNVDLYSYISDLPEKPGKYMIYATVNDVKSNVVEIEVEVEKGATPGPREPGPM